MPFVEQADQTFRVKINHDNMGNLPIKDSLTKLSRGSLFYMLEISLPKSSFDNANERVQVVRDSKFTVN